MNDSDRYDNGLLYDGYDYDEESEAEDDSPADRILSEEQDSDRKGLASPALEGTVPPLEVSKSGENEIPRDMLRQDYAVHVVEMRHGTKPPEYGVYWNGTLAFSTADRDIERQLVANGIHRTAELTGGREADLVNYDAYLRQQYGAHLVTIQSGLNTRYALYIGGRMLEANDMRHLQEQVEAGNFTPTASGAPDRVRVTRFPDGKTGVTFTDGSEVLLDTNRVPLRYRTPEGSTFTRTAQGPPQQWTDGTVTWTGSFSFENGRTTFNFVDHPTRQSIVFNGDGTTRELFKNGSVAGYRGSELFEYRDNQGSVRLSNSGSTVELVSPDGRTVERFTRSGTQWTLGDEPASAEKVIGLHQRMSQVYENLGLYRESLAAQRVVVAQMERNFVPGDTTLATAYDRAAALARASDDNRSATRSQSEATEIRRVASYLQELREAPDPIAVTSSIIRRLPDQIRITTEGQSVRLSSDSFARLLQAIPGMRVGDATSVTQLRSVALDGNTLRLDGNARLRFPGPGGMDVELAFNNTTAELKVDPDDPSKMILDNIRGVSAGVPPLMVNIKSLSIQLQEDADGNLSLRVTPTLEPGPLADLAGRNIEPVNIPIGHKDDTPLPALFRDIRQWVANPGGRDVPALAASVAGMFIDNELSGMLRGLRSVERNGDRITLTTNGGEPHSLGGLLIAWDQTVSARLVNEGGRLALTDIRGARFGMALPGDLAASLGIGGNIDIPVTEVSFSAPDANGHRIATIKSSGAVESITVKVDANMQPVAIDNSGRIAVDIAMKQNDQQLSMRVTFNPAQAANPRNMDFTLTVNGNAEAAPRAVEAFFGNQLDPVLRNALRGIQSIEKRGDRVVIRRSAASNHELNGLNIHLGTEVSFRIGAGDNMSLSEINGVAITSLPDLAGTIYRQRLPIILRSFSLSEAGPGGGRTMSIQSSGPLRSASIRLDGAMNPTDTVVVVENPVSAFRENIDNSTALLMMRRRTPNDTYTIRVDSAGNVDLGGLGNLADMFSNAGDLLSFEGAVITAAGYVAQTVNGNPVGAARGVWGAIERTWDAIFGN